MKNNITINQPLLLAICGFIALASGTILNIVIGADKMP